MSFGLASVALAVENDGTSAIEQAKEHAGQMVSNVQNKASELANATMEKAGQLKDATMEQAEALKQQAQAKFDETAKRIEQSEQAKKLTAGLLNWIYQLAELLSFSAFHWLAFGLMVAGVVSWGLQVVLGKLILISSGNFDYREVISDVTVLAISLIGLVLTTQAAAENSSFTQSSVAVLSSAVVGIIFGIMLYRWGQAQEVEAAKARS